MCLKKGAPMKPKPGICNESNINRVYSYTFSYTATSSTTSDGTYAWIDTTAQTSFDTVTVS